MGVCAAAIAVAAGALPAFASPASAAETVSGIDVSSHQGSVDWGAVRAAGEDFAFVRSGVGNSSPDNTFAAHYDRAKAAGLIPGAYHAADPDLGANDAVREAQWFASRLGTRTKGDGELPAALDLELNANNLSQAQLRAWTQDFLDELERLTGKKPIIYTSPAFWESQLGDASTFSSNPLWIAHYDSSPRIPRGWSRYTFWQYTATGSVSGVSGAVDRNRFNGTISDLRALAGGSAGRSFSGVATMSRGAGLLDVFATGSDGVVRHRAWVRDHWSGWVSLRAGMSVKVVGDPAAVSARAGRIDVFARGADNHLKRLVWTSTSGWGLWQDVDGVISASPAATTRSDTGVDVFARNAAGQIIFRHLDVATNSWSGGWGALHDQRTSSGPAVVSSPDGTRMNVFARDDDGTLLSLMWTVAGGWYSWVDHEQATMTGRPTASTRSGYTVDVFLRGPDNHLRHWYSPNGADWNAGNIGDLGGVIFASPASVSQNNERIDVFSRNGNADLIQRIWSYNNPPAGWYPWIGLGPIP
jgi:GH25 family lysozyme M1 (1,4-beta-N-acetylmuramidase)